jgi:hypothetical protein
VRMTGRPELPEIQAFARLVRLGQVPTRGAVQGEMVSLAAADARRRALKQARAAVLEDLEGTGRAAAAYVAAHRERTGAGPSWADLRRHTGWPREITDSLMGKLRGAGWLAYDDEPGSLRAGPATAAVTAAGDPPRRRPRGRRRRHRAVVGFQPRPNQYRPWTQRGTPSRTSPPPTWHARRWSGADLAVTDSIQHDESLRSAAL